MGRRIFPTRHSRRTVSHQGSSTRLCRDHRGSSRSAHTCSNRIGLIMSTRRKAGIALIAVTLALSACSRHGTGPKEYSVTNDTGLGSTGSTASTRVPPTGTGGSNSTGATNSGAVGSSTASTPAPSGPQEKVDQRGNTPPGVSRDGAGPAGGAIVDPSGVTKK